ncbi:hypothetical protein KSP35_17255 [Aquihabitans sp. G128]|uniref:ArnT family glycosyltransferase n=1 Tax=Aquihabitans sp. G128 TaxID=2849779 RepID=UPI001C217003|nr:hypothetical protein [Aquihabitans sp. G128]QXC60092.1 hypothetical protein KSP35_17255 [Aquihabitans sp. G128]
MSLDAPAPTAPPDPVDTDQVEVGDGTSALAEPGPSSDGDRTLRRKLRAPLAVSLVLQLVIAAGDKLPSVDGTAYFEAGRNLLSGNGFTREGGPELHFPPLTPVGLAGLEKVTGSELAALRIWGFLTSALVVLFLVLLAQRIWRDHRTTVAVAWIGGTVSGLTPLFTRQGGGSEPIALATLLAAVWCALVALDDETSERKRTLLLMASGLSVGLAYLARPESLLPGFFIGLGLVIEALRRPGSLGVRVKRMLAWALPFGLVVLICLFPYLAYLHSHTGKWSATDKSQDASIQAWRAVAENNRLERDRVLYAINSSGTGLGVPTRPLTALAKEDPSGWLGIVGVNIQTLFRVYVVPGFAAGPNWHAIPAFLLIPAFMAMWRDRKRRSAQILTALAISPVITCIVFFTQARYLVVTTAVLALYAGRGLVQYVLPWKPRARHIALGLTVVLMATSTIGEIKPLLPGITTNDPTEQAAAGRWIDAHTPPKSRIMTRSFHVQYYAHRPVVAMPSSDFGTLLTFARRMGVDYVVADEATISRRRPELYAALLQWRDPPGLRLVKIIERRGQQVRIFQLDPLPAPSDRPPIPLGYVSD